MPECLAVDWGTTIVGILDIGSGIYTPYRGDRTREGAARVQSCAGTIVTFNGTFCDLPELAKILGVTKLSLCGVHDDMREITSRQRWPPDPGTDPILGENLTKTYTYYFGNEFSSEPPHLVDEYEISNWQDCFRAAELWKRWKAGELKRAAA
jgi:hypothetical protein